MIKATMIKELEHLWEAIVELREDVTRLSDKVASLDHRTVGSVRVGESRVPKIDGGFLDD